MSLECKAALKVEEVVENAKGRSNITEMWDTLDQAFLPTIIMNQSIDSLPQYSGDSVKE